MDDLACSAEPLNGSQKAQVLVIIEHQVLARTCILSILKRELTGFDIVEMATTDGLNWLSGRDVRLIALNIGDREITDPSSDNDWRHRGPGFKPPTRAYGRPQSRSVEWSTMCRKSLSVVSIVNSW
jgi:hypothetical protein